jgi:teichuronic acid exporter
MTIQAAAAGMKWASLAKIAAQAITWSITLVVIRVLDPADYGIAAVAAVFVALLGSIAELGLGAALVQARSIGEEEAARVAGAALALNAAGAVLVVLASPAIGWIFGDPRIGTVAAVSSATLVLNAFATVPESHLYREMRFRRLAFVDVISAAAGSGATLAMALAGWGVWALVLGSVTGTFARAVALVSLSRWVRPRFSRDGLAVHLRFGGALTAGRLAWQTAQQCDVLIGGRFLSEAALGLYTVSAHLARMPMHKVMSVINQVAFPAVARMQDDRERLAGRLVDATALLGLTTVPLLWGLSSVAPEFVRVVLGAQWIEAVTPLRLAAVVVPVQLLSNVFSTALTGLGRADVELRNMVTALVVTAGAVLVGVQAGATGLAAAACVASPLALALNVRRTNAVLCLPARGMLAAVRGPVLAGVVMYAAVTAARELLGGTDPLLRLPVLIFTGAVFYVGAITLFDRRSWVLLGYAARVLKAA